MDTKQGGYHLYVHSKWHSPKRLVLALLLFATGLILLVPEKEDEGNGIVVLVACRVDAVVTAATRQKGQSLLVPLETNQVLLDRAAACYLRPIDEHFNGTNGIQWGM
jgi:hypothetical protein